MHASERYIHDVLQTRVCMTHDLKRLHLCDGLQHFTHMRLRDVALQTSTHITVTHVIMHTAASHHMRANAQARGVSHRAHDVSIDDLPLRDGLLSYGACQDGLCDDMLNHGLYYLSWLHDGVRLDMFYTQHTHMHASHQ